MAILPLFQLPRFVDFTITSGAHHYVPIFVVIVLACLMYSAWWWFLFFNAPCVITGDEGVISYSGEYTLYTPWENIKEICIWPQAPQLGLRLARLPEPLSIEQGVRDRQVAIVCSKSYRRRLKNRGRYDGTHYISLPLWLPRALRKDIQYHLPADIPGYDRLGKEKG